MPAFEESAVCRAPATEVWKLLHDPVRFTTWWAALSRAELSTEGANVYTRERPDLPLPLRVTAGGRDVTIKCLSTDDAYTWTLEPHADGCRISVRVEVPEGQDERLRTRRADVLASLPNLVAVAEAVS